MSPFFCLVRARGRWASSTSLRWQDAPAEQKREARLHLAEIHRCPLSAPKQKQSTQGALLLFCGHSIKMQLLNQAIKRLPCWFAISAGPRKHRSEGKALLCLGSLYMYGEVREAVERKAKWHTKTRRVAQNELRACCIMQFIQTEILSYLRSRRPFSWDSS